MCVCVCEGFAWRRGLTPPEVGSPVLGSETDVGVNGSIGRAFVYGGGYGGYIQAVGPGSCGTVFTCQCESWWDMNQHAHTYTQHANLTPHSANSHGAQSPYSRGALFVNLVKSVLCSHMCVLYIIYAYSGCFLILHS